MRGGAHLYIIQSHVTGAVKIGRSSDVPARLSSLQTGSPHRLKILAVFEGKGDIEQRLHRDLESFRLRVQGEWFHHDCLPNMPDWIYDQLPFDDRWWIPDQRLR